jgi:hypothetical protein
MGMTGTNPWHADDRMLVGYVNGSLDLAAAMSLEQHVMRCQRCRDALSGQVDIRPLAGVWERVEAKVDGSLRQRWRRTRFRLRSRSGLRVGAAVQDLPGSSWGAVRAGRPNAALVWFGGVALSGLAVLSAGWVLLVGAGELTRPGGGFSPPTSAVQVDRQPFGTVEVQRRLLDQGPSRRIAPQVPRRMLDPI